MAVTAVPQIARNVSEIPIRTTDSRRFLRIVAAGTLVTSGVLLAAGKRRAGLATALSGAALVMIEQREAVGRFWNALPRFLGATQGVLSRAQSAVEDLNTQTEKLRHILKK